jgi:DNA polymerase elongation subunit (family B)
MPQLRKEQNIKWTSKKELEFQVLDWKGLDVLTEPESDSEDEEEHYKPKQFKYTIRMFGVTKKGYSVCLTVTDFKPYFFISIPDKWKKAQIQLLLNTITERLIKYNVTTPEFKIVKRHKFRGFTNNALQRYAKLEFDNSRGMNRFKDMFYTEINILGKKHKFDLYEAKLDPMLRFIHINDIKAAGWIRLKKNQYEVKNINPISKCQIDVVAHWKEVQPFDNNSISPMLIASFDIEADSSHGDFPLAKKTYKKLASDILVHYWTSLATIQKYKNVANQRSIWRKYIKHNLEEDEIKRKRKINPLLKNTKISVKINDILIDSKTDHFIKSKVKEVNRIRKMIQNEEKYLYNLIASSFGLIEEIENISFIVTKKNKKPTPKTIQSIINDIKYICQFKQNKIKGNNELKEGVKEIVGRMENCNTIQQVEWVIDDVARKRYLNKLHLQIKVLIKDVLVGFIDDIMSKAFPSVKGDRVIQIGTVIQKYGDPNIFMKHIITLNGCDPIAGAIVVPCKTEKQVLLEWHKFINALDPDIITGYNIFGFDEIFMYDRACELGCMEIFATLGRIIDDEPKLEEKHLSSSALGDNILYYIQMTGRVQIDVFKVIQRDHNLNSYKLDSVANHFIEGDVMQIGSKYPKQKLKLISKEIKKYNGTDVSNYIEVDGIKDLSIGNFVYLNQKNTYDQSLDGQKFKIMDIVQTKYIDKQTKDEIIKHGLVLDMPVDQNLLSDSEVKYCWGLAKDDVHHTDIFKLQKGSDSDRKRVAVYCIQDCALLIHLINKLCIITNNMGMANVCSVPFSYIFLRGQGIKLFSFVGKQCRLDNYLIPDLIKESELEEKKNKLNKNRRDRLQNILNENKLSNVSEESQYKLDGEGYYHIGYQEDDVQKGYLVKDNDDGYEGAIVIQPEPDIYMEPVAITDYGSLYPASMISENLSHDSIVFDLKYDNLPGYDYLDITYEIKKILNTKLKSAPKVTVGYKTCRFAQFPKGEKGIIPKILMKLLKARKETRAQIQTEPDKFKQAILDGLQMAYKTTANSLYGQIGARTSSIYLKDIAASTTATGRRLLLYARHFAEKNIKGCECVYGDSIPGDEPILYQTNNNIKVETIEMIGNNYQWIDYPQFIKGHNKQQCFPVNMKIYVDDKWVTVKRLIRHNTKKKIYRVLTRTGCVDVTEDHSLINNEGQMIKPEDCKVGETQIKYSFPYHHKFENNYPKDFPYYECDTKLEAQKKYCEIISIWNLPIVFVDYRDGKYIVRSRALNDKEYHCHYKDLMSVRSVNFLRYTDPDEYVYDIETECGWFTAGIGGITLKNTDSIFVKFADENGNKLQGIEGLQTAIDKGIQIEKSIQMYYKKPHKLEYEKTFWPFILFTKKRYVGHLYEKDVTKYKQKSMGIVLKRRDNAPIVKYVYGGIIKTIMIEQNIKKSIEFLKTTLQDLLDGKFDVNLLIISKTLRGYYKDPDSIAHKVLADRMAERDPGNKPQVNDRIPYVYIDVIERENMLQGDKIEHIDYVKEHNLIPNYLFYITNQIMKPVSQIYELIVDKLEGYNKGDNYFHNTYFRLLDKFDGNELKARTKVSKLKQAEVKKLLFSDIIIKFINKQEGYGTIDDFWEKVQNDDDEYDDEYDNINFDNMFKDEFEIQGKTTRKKKQVNYDSVAPDFNEYDDIIQKICKEKMGNVKVRKTMDISQFMTPYF